MNEAVINLCIDVSHVFLDFSWVNIVKSGPTKYLCVYALFAYIHTQTHIHIHPSVRWLITFVRFPKWTRAYKTLRTTGLVATPFDLCCIPSAQWPDSCSEVLTS